MAQESNRSNIFKIKICPEEGSVFIAILNSDFPWLWSPETQRSPLSPCRAASAHVCTHACMCVFHFYCIYCVCILSFRNNKPLPTTTSNKNSVSLDTSPEISFSLIHSFRCERRRTRWPCLLSASVQLFFFLLQSVASLYSKC